MHLLANQKVKALFVEILLCVLGVGLVSALLIGLQVSHAALYIVLSSLCLGGSVAMLCYRYFKVQHRLMENAILQMRNYLSGNREARIDCDDEGDIYRLFHEVNALAAAPNAHAEKEKSDKEFMRRTLLDISHQLKTPLATLNVYLGILQQAATLACQRFLPLCEQELDRMEALGAESAPYLQTVLPQPLFPGYTGSGAWPVPCKSRGGCAQRYHQGGQHTRRRRHVYAEFLNSCKIVGWQSSGSRIALLSYRYQSGKEGSIRWICYRRFAVGEEFAAIPLFGLSGVGIVGGIAMGLTTVLLAARAPAKLAARVSPIITVTGNAQSILGTGHAVSTRLLKIDIALGVRHTLSS